MFTSLSALAANVPAAVAAHGPWDGGGFWPLFLLIPLFWILVIGFFIFFARRSWRHNHHWAATQGAEGCCANATPAVRSTRPNTASASKCCARIRSSVHILCEGRFPGGLFQKVVQ